MGRGLFSPLPLGTQNCGLYSACVFVLSTARPSGKIARWALKHRAGKYNTNADVLSRNPIPKQESQSCGRCVGDCQCDPGDYCCVEDNSCVEGVISDCDHSSPTCVGCGCHIGGCLVSDGCGCDDQPPCYSRGRSEGVESELFTGELVLLVDEIKNDPSVVQIENENGVVNNDDDVKLCESLTEIHQMQMADADLLPYTEYHMNGVLPDDQRSAQKIVL